LNSITNAVAYTGTHDNNTMRGWFEECSKKQQQRVWNYLNRRQGDSADVTPALMEALWSSSAGLAIAPLQDLLNLGSEARMNVPGCPRGNWRWRCKEQMLSPHVFKKLNDLTTATNRR